MQKQKLQKILESYKNLKDGWDGEDTSRAPQNNILSCALSFLNRIPDGWDLPEISVCGNGEINFFWTDLKRKRNVRMSFLEPNVIGYSYKLSTEVTAKAVSSDNVLEIENAIREFTFT